MNDSTVGCDVAESDAVIVARLREKYPSTKPLWAVLLAEILSGSTTEDKMKASLIFGSNRYQRGLKSITRLINEYASTWSSTSDDYCGVEREHENRRFVRSLLIAIGKMRSKAAHDVLVHFVLTYPDPGIRGDALEAMAYEEQEFDLEFVFGYVGSDHPAQFRLSALYALECQHVIFDDPDRIRTLVGPLLRDEDPWVRSYSASVLRYDPANREIVRELLDDPVAFVVEAGLEAMHMMDLFEDAESEPLAVR